VHQTFKATYDYGFRKGRSLGLALGVTAGVLIGAFWTLATGVLIHFAAHG
jgi:hypothetical protein